MKIEKLIHQLLCITLGFALLLPLLFLVPQFEYFFNMWVLRFAVSAVVALLLFRTAQERIYAVIIGVIEIAGIEMLLVMLILYSYSSW